MRYVLALDTAFSAINVGVLNAETGEGWSLSVPTERGQAEHLVPLIADVLNEAGVQYNQIDLIAVTRGPGSFTGVRVGLAAARGIALVVGCPLVGVTTVDALCATWGGQGSVTVLIDTKRNDLFVARYNSTADMPLPPDAITIETPGNIYTGQLLGDGVKTDGKNEEGVILWPDPLALAALGLRLYGMPGYTNKNPAEPLYLREAEVSRPKILLRIPLDRAIQK